MKPRPKMKTSKIIVDWNDIKSIKNAERRKVSLENKGFTLLETVNTLNTSAMYYELNEG